MKSTSRLPKILRGTFTVLEFLAVLVIAGALVLGVLTIGFPATAAKIRWELPPVGLMPESGVLTVKSDPAVGEAICIVSLRGSVVVAQNPHGSGGVISSISKCYGPPFLLICAGFFAVLFDLLRRLFRNVERGDSFTERNIRLVHKIGVSIIVFSLVSSAANSLSTLTLASYLNEHASVEGIRASFIPVGNISMASGSHHFALHFDLYGILTGLLVLTLGEVFRQGLALKQENELTI